MTRDRLISFFFIGLLLFVVYQFCLIFSPFFRAIFWSGILAFAFYPIYDKIRPLFKSHNTLAAALMTLLIALIVIPPVVILIVNITKQAIEVYQLAAVYIREGHLGSLIDQIRNFPFIQKIETHLVQWDIIRQSAESWLLNSTRAVGNYTAAQFGHLTKNILLLILNVLMMFFLVFIFLKDGNNIYKFIYDVAPLEEKNKKAIFDRISATFSAVIRGQVLTSIAQALSAGILFWAVGVPVPIIFGFATFITSLVPFIGASGIWLPLALYLFFQHAYIKAAILGIVGLVVISHIDNILKPALIGERTKLPYFLLFFGILGGIKLYGLMGIFLAPVVLSLFFALIKIYQEKFFQEFLPRRAGKVFKA